MALRDAMEGKEYVIRKIDTDDGEFNDFLFSLGCYSGENITIISKQKSSLVVSIKDSRYSIDNRLAESILI